MNLDRSPMEAYQGDAVLSALLLKNNTKFSVAAVKSLLSGVLGTPDSGASGTWLDLISTDPSPALRAQLLALHRMQADGAGSPWRPDRIAALRSWLTRHDLAGFILPRGDEHMGEYVPKSSDRLAWLTGFTGSAGMAIVLRDRAAMFTDGRYTLQVRTQVDGAIFEYRHLVDEPPPSWLKAALKAGDRVGYDPWLHTPDALARLRAAASEAGAALVALDANPVDAIWRDRPARPLAPVVAHPPEFAGRAHADKRAQVAQRLGDDRFDAAVISAPDSIAWLLNVRGGDVPHTPLPLSFAVVAKDGAVDWFVDDRKLHPTLRPHLGNQVRVRAPDEMMPALGGLKGRVLVDQATAAIAIVETLKAAGAEVVTGTDPCVMPKACKTPDELGHIRDAHVRDAAALARFFAWIAVEGPKGNLTELDAMARLEAIRREGAHFRDTSFTTIAGAGANGAIVHYRSSEATNARIAPDQLLLIDSGGQYLDGTTDVTRTVAIGKATAEQRDRFTRVLKGHIALAMARFPAGTTGSQLDALARMPLWQVGLDFDHGTGHGVGYYLSVHEGPHRISKMPNTVALQPGMVVSNEPGYYKTGAYGIRIENLVAVREIDVPGAERKMLGFETLTLCPIDRALIEPGLLTAEERAWLNDYHARVRATVTPLVEPDVAAWLEAATAPV